MPKSIVNSPLKMFGAKYYMRRHILSLFPPRDSYMTLFEPYCGTAAVTLAHDYAGKSEIVNDIDGCLTAFWRCLQHPIQSQEFIRRASVQPFSQADWARSKKFIESFDAESVNDPVDVAFHYFVMVRQSLGGQGDDFAPVSTGRIRAGKNEQVSAWLSAVSGLPEVHNRIIRWLIHNDDAVKLILKYDKPGVVIYADPPYVPDARVAKKVYKYEMTVEQHADLLSALKGLKSAKVLLSGYPSKMYEEILKGWRVVDLKIDNKASHKKVKDAKIERIWLNY